MPSVEFFAKTRTTCGQTNAIDVPVAKKPTIVVNDTFSH